MFEESPIMDIFTYPLLQLPSLARAPWKITMLIPTWTMLLPLVVATL
jgi:hypothetical protein